jgi:hypothetical protein
MFSGRFSRYWNETPVRVKVIDIALGASVLGSALYGVYQLFYVPEPVRNMVTLAARTDLVQDRIGFPVRISPFWTGTVLEDRCRVDVPISGPRGSGKLFGQAVKAALDEQAPQWQMIILEASFDPANDVEKKLGEIPTVDIIELLKLHSKNTKA